MSIDESSKTDPPAAGKLPQPAGAGTRTRLDAASRRALIMKAARDLFSQQGYHATVSSELAAAAGCSEAMIYRHFPSKQALFAAVLRESVERVRQSIAEATQRAQASGTLDSNPMGQMMFAVEELLVNPDLLPDVRLRAQALSELDDPEIRAVVTELNDGYRTMVETSMMLSQQAGTVRDDVDPSVVAWLWIGLLLSTVYRSSTEGDEAVKDQARVAREFFRMLQIPAPRDGH